jgi:hypothetical protein
MFVPTQCDVVACKLAGYGKTWLLICKKEDIKEEGIYVIWKKEVIQRRGIAE